MRRKWIVLCILLALLGCQEEPPVPVAGSSKEPASQVTKTPVRGVVVTSQGFDRDGDGQLDTWRKREPDGTILEGHDTNGDGKPDSFQPITAKDGMEGFGQGSLEASENTEKNK